MVVAGWVVVARVVVARAPERRRAGGRLDRDEASARQAAAAGDILIASLLHPDCALIAS